MLDVPLPVYGARTVSIEGKRTGAADDGGEVVIVVCGFTETVTGAQTVRTHLRGRFRFVVRQHTSTTTSTMITMVNANTHMIGTDACSFSNISFRVTHWLSTI